MLNKEHEKHRHVFENHAKNGICDGNCNKHDGERKLVRVYDNDVDFGYFSYCEEAIKTDLKNGWNVDIK